MTDKTLPTARTALIETTLSVVDTVRRTRFFEEKSAFRLDATSNFSSGQTVLRPTVDFTLKDIVQFILVYSYEPFVYDLTVGTETIHGVTCSGTLLLTNPVATLALRAPPGEEVRIEYAYS